MQIIANQLVVCSCHSRAERRCVEKLKIRDSELLLHITLSQLWWRRHTLIARTIKTKPLKQLIIIFVLC